MGGGATTAAAALLATVGLVGSSPGPGPVTRRTLQLPAGRATRTFELRERSGVILLNRLVVPHDVRAVARATIPRIAGVRVDTGTAACRRERDRDVCTQGEEGCPMPAATWRVTLTKLAGPAGAVRFELLVAPPPRV